MKGYLPLICLSFTLSGCAGLATPFINNPYAGNYDGTYTSTTGDHGTASIQLTKLGHLFGTLTDQTSGKTGTLTASGDKNLVISGTISFPSTSDMSVTGTFVSNDNIIKGTLKGSAYSDAFILTKQ